MRHILRGFGLGLVASQASGATTILSATPPQGASQPIPAGYVSFSIEFSSFPDFAGNLSLPNAFSDNLLNNLGNLTGKKPVIRVGGNTQDYALLDSNLKVATNGTFTSKSQDYPTALTYGPSYFESYDTWPGVTFIHGFNLAKNGTVADESRLNTVPLACKALEGGKLAYWELGNEPDLYKTSAQGIVRPASWNEQAYVDEWLNKSRGIKSALSQACPDLSPDFIAPSFAGIGNSLNPVTTWSDGLDQDKDIALISSHNYIGGATQPGVTLQGTLMNHSSTAASVNKQVTLSSQLGKYGVPFILGETNSLYNEGAPGLSNAFGAALWGVDFNLYCASQGIRRVHMHQGTNYRYASWQPIATDKTTLGTKAPYYGNIAVAATLGDLTKSNVSVANLPQQVVTDAAYAIYVDDKLARVAVLNMIEYNYTAGVTNAPRSSKAYSFSVPSGYQGEVKIQRLAANGSNAITGITFDGYSYNYELDNGKPALLKNITRGETTNISNGVLTVNVPYSSFALLSFD